MTIYLNHQIITAPSLSVIEAMKPFLGRLSLSSMHAEDQALLVPLKEAYRTLYSFFGATEKETLLITSSGAEAVNHLIWSLYFDQMRLNGKNHILHSALDEAPALLAINRLKELGCQVTTLLPNAEGIITSESVAAALRPETLLLSLSGASGLTGVIQPVEEIAILCRERGVLLHVDVNHSINYRKIYFHKSGIDFLTFSGELMHAPQGTGGLLIREGLKLSPLILGGNEQGGYRGGHLNIPAFMGLAQAVREISAKRESVAMEVAQLRDFFEEEVTRRIPAVVPYFRTQWRLPHISALSFPDVNGELLCYLLSRKGVHTTFGGGLLQHILHLLHASHIPEHEAHTALSFALSRDTTREMLSKALDILFECYARARSFAVPLGDKICP